MRYLNGLKIKRMNVDSKAWLDEDYDVLAEREYMKKRMDARRLAKDKLARLKLIKKLCD